jgi:transcriptional regulator with XRE-family HTH domain
MLRNEDGMKEFSDLLREKREEKGLTVRALERLLSERSRDSSISRTLISYLETRDRVPTYEVAYAIAEALEIDPIEAIEAACISRLKHGNEKEAKSLKDFQDKMGLEWESVDIMLIAQRSL